MWGGPILPETITGGERNRLTTGPYVFMYVSNTRCQCLNTRRRWRSVRKLTPLVLYDPAVPAGPASGTPVKAQSFERRARPYYL